MKRNRPLNEEKRKAILKASIEEFYNKGYESASMDAISKNANVSKATVYNHFKNKEELFLAIASILKERFEQSFSYTYTKKKSIKQQLTEIATQEMTFLNDKENIKLLQIITAIIMQKNELGLKLLEDSKDTCMIMTSGWFEAAKKDGLLEFEDSSFVSHQFISHIKSFAFYPQLFGAPHLNKKEQKNIIEKSAQMIIKLYGVNT